MILRAVAGIRLVAGLRLLPQRSPPTRRPSPYCARAASMPSASCGVSSTDSLPMTTRRTPRDVSRSISGVRDRRSASSPRNAWISSVGDAAMERDLLDLAGRARPRTKPVSDAEPLAEPRVVDDHVVADEADDERGRVGQVRRAGGGERLNRSQHQRVLRCVKLGGAEARGEPANELVGVPAHAGYPSRG